jgi:hypothetical protein
MKNSNGSFKAMALIACGVLFLSLLGSNAVAGKKRQPPAYLLWPADAQLVLDFYSGNWGGTGRSLAVGWPIADGVDHYRVKAEVTSKGNTYVFVDQSPADYYLYAEDGMAWERFSFAYLGSYLVTVTAYSGPDEARAYSESLQASGYMRR